MFTREQEELLEKIKDKSHTSRMWPFWVESKLADLLDIYAGYYSEIHPRDENLTIEYSKKLVEYCKNNRRLFPNTKENNEILMDYRETSLKKNVSRQEKYDIDRRITPRTPIKEKDNKSVNNKNNYAITHNDIALLIEGHQSEKFSEVRAAVHLAKINGCSYFDVISSYDALHISEALLKSNETKKKFIVLSIYLFFASHGDTQQIIEKLIIPPFQYLVEKNKIDCIPTWVSELNVYTINSFVQSVLNEYFDGEVTKFVSINGDINKELIDLSNELSLTKLKEYLTSKPEIKTIYGLIGSAHLPMLPSSHLSEAVKDYLHSEILIEERLINVYLFGGMHGTMAHYEKMADFVHKKDRKSVV